MSSTNSYSTAALALDIKSIAESPRFVFQARLAHELGLLAPLLAGHQEEVERLSAELLSRLSSDRSHLRRQVQGVLDTLSCRREIPPQSGAVPSIQTDGLPSVRSLDRVATPG